jgi:hypothetical protein
MTMTRGISIPRRAVRAATSRGGAMRYITPNRMEAEVRRAGPGGRDERNALRRDHAYVEAAAFAALRQGRA